METLIEGALTTVDVVLSVRQGSSLGQFIKESCLHWAELLEKDFNEIPLT